MYFSIVRHCAFHILNEVLAAYAQAGATLKINICHTPKKKNNKTFGETVSYGSKQIWVQAPVAVWAACSLQGQGSAYSEESWFIGVSKAAVLPRKNTDTFFSPKENNIVPKVVKSGQP